MRSAGRLGQVVGPLEAQAPIHTCTQHAEIAVRHELQLLLQPRLDRPEPVLGQPGALRLQRGLRLLQPLQAELRLVRVDQTDRLGVQPEHKLPVQLPRPSAGKPLQSSSRAAAAAVCRGLRARCVGVALSWQQPDMPQRQLLLSRAAGLGVVLLLLLLAEPPVGD